MKKIILLGLAMVLFISCNKQDKRYTQQSPEIETVKTLILNYNNKAYDTSIYADTSKTFYNSKEKSMSPSETIEYHKANDANYSSRGFLTEDQEYEMVVTDDGETWVNCWLDWRGTLTGNNKEVTMPIHLTYQFVDGKVVREVGMWDGSEVVLAFQEMEAQANMPDSEKLIQATMNNLRQGWIKNDLDLFNSNSAETLTRSVNGVRVINSQKEYNDLIQTNHNMLSNINIVMHDLFFKDNKAYGKWTFSGKNTGEINGAPATNKQVSINGFAIWSFNKEGQAINEDVYFDQNDINMQLGYTLTPPK